MRENRDIPLHAIFNFFIKKKLTVTLNNNSLNTCSESFLYLKDLVHSFGNNQQSKHQN
jgi:hypothetical protein